MTTIKSRIAPLLIASFSLLAITGCETTGSSADNNVKTAYGAAAGALIGGVIGHQSGEAGAGALIGAVVGGVGTKLTLQQLEAKNRDIQVERAQVAQRKAVVEKSISQMTAANVAPTTNTAPTTNVGVSQNSPQAVARSDWGSDIRSMRLARAEEQKNAELAQKQAELAELNSRAESLDEAERELQELIALEASNP